MRPITVVVVSTNALIRNGIQQVVMKSDILSKSLPFVRPFAKLMNFSTSGVRR
ncbi:MAG: hypothetical protein IPO91_34075 [Chloroflexi bacterium]|nr:hypothetical protein [Chloroflexota bacterium]